MRRATFVIAGTLFFGAFVTTDKTVYAQPTVSSYRAEDDTLVCVNCSTHPEVATNDAGQPEEIAVVRTATPSEHQIATVYIALSIHIAPSGDAVAVCAMDKPSDGAEGIPYLSIITLSGREISRFTGGMRAAWSPDGKRLAYTLGRTADGCPNLQNGSTYVYDMETGESSKLVGDSGDLEWARFDGNLYIQSSKILKYDPRTCNVIETAYQSVSLSTNGDYYYAVPCEPPLFIFDRRTNIDITSKVPLLSRPRYSVLPRRWLGPSTLAVEYYPIWGTCDVASGEIRMAPGEPISFSKDSQYLIVFKRASINSKALISRVKVSDLKLATCDEFIAFRDAMDEEEVRKGTLTPVGNGK